MEEQHLERVAADADRRYRSGLNLTISPMPATMRALDDVANGLLTPLALDDCGGLGGGVDGRLPNYTRGVPKRPSWKADGTLL
jgi:hypothetical protein